MLWLALWMFPLGAVFLAISVFAGVLASNAWIGLAVFSLFAVIFHALLVRQIPYYFQKVVERG